MKNHAVEMMQFKCLQGKMMYQNLFVFLKKLVEKLEHAYSVILNKIRSRVHNWLCHNTKLFI